MKTFGKRKPPHAATTSSRILEFVRDLRAALGFKKFIPKGVHRFKTFEEAQAWSLKMMARNQKS
ncbi:MAG: hypothetical protein HYW49_11965 [Deltaproteobacteria bacterium]|nr:hypothetical protein [Deltaproteobacteria bacterium]